MKINKIDNENNGIDLELPIIPLRELVVFPQTTKKFYVGRRQSILSVDAALDNYKGYIILATQRNSEIENPGLEDLYNICVLAKIVEISPTPEKKVIKLTVSSIDRIELKQIIETEKVTLAKYNEIEDQENSDTNKIDVLKNVISREFQKFINIAKIPQNAISGLDPALVVEKNYVFNLMPFLSCTIEYQIKILEANNLESRLSLIAEVIFANIENIRLEKKITLGVKKKLEKTQKDFFLNEQIKEIQKELGHLPEENELYNIEDFAKKLTKLGLPDSVKEKVIKEQKRMLRMSPMSPESGIIRNYIDWIMDLPWKDATDDSDNLNHSKEVLDKEHFSLKKAKNRILEFLAVRKLNPKTKGPILCFVGPPGTGKTSLTRSVADAIGREFIRISLGGVRDEAEIRGHRRTYLGALPGKIIQSMKKVKATNPVFLLDEIDKMSSDFRGDPASALLEVLDPEQNTQFTDHYLEVPYDLSSVLFIATANSTQGIPYPLLDRMELIYISSYTEYEKFKIAREFLIPREMKENGIEDLNLHLSDQALLDIIRFYTMEAGVRALQRQIATICRKIAKKVVMSDNTALKEKVNITKKNLHIYLGKKKYLKHSMEDFLDVGVSHGLAWSELGGSLLPIEIVIYPGEGKLQLTGKLGDVMKESAHAAFSYIKANADKYDIKYENFYKDCDIHIHFPEGAIPKDGPSAGIAITCAILSALTKVSIKSSIAMTGEITLTGRILPIGGLKEKSLAAIRHKKEGIIIPFDNLKDIDELPVNMRKKVKFHNLKRAEEAFEIAFATDDYKKKITNENG